MTKEKLVDYVMTTPNNPNLAVLSSLIDKHDKDILDKAGGVKTVNSIVPDEQGNVAIAYDDLEGKPFGEINEVEEVIFEEQTIELVDYSADTYDPKRTLKMAIVNIDGKALREVLIEGATYRVTMNGITYICSPHNNAGFGWTLGETDSSALEFKSSITHPFVLSDGFYFATEANNVTLKIEKGEFELKKLDPKFLPEAVLPEYLALEIPDNAHKNDTALTDAYYPLARKVGENAFNGCSKLASVIAPYLRRIGMSAFRGCSALTTADFPHVTFIDLHAFENCDALTTVDFPAVHTVNSYAFKNCDKLTTINMPLIDTIGSEVFEACSSLTAVYFPNAIQILRYAFLNAYSLTTANFPLLKYIEEYAFQHCSKLATIDSPLVVRIGTSAFHGCSALTTADFPSCEEIYIKAFKDCTKLKSLILRKETRVTLRDANAFDSTPISEGTGYIYVPSALVDSYKAAAEWSTYANQFRALEDYTVDGTITGELDETKINATA